MGLEKKARSESSGRRKKKEKERTWKNKHVPDERRGEEIFIRQQGRASVRCQKGKEIAMFAMNSNMLAHFGFCTAEREGCATKNWSHRFDFLRKKERDPFLVSLREKHESLAFIPIRF